MNSTGKNHYNVSLSERLMQLAPILTIGYAQRNFGDLLSLLKVNQIAFLVDVRSQPVSRYQPEFSRDSLQEHLLLQGIRYVFMGDALGGRPQDESCYLNGHVMYDLVRERGFFRAGILRLETASREHHRVCLLCSELKPEDCHRSKLIGVSLEQIGVPILHIDASGAKVTQQDVIARLQCTQPGLFPTGLHSRRSYKVKNRFR